LCRDLIAIRRASQDLRGGESETLARPPGVWAWRRGERFVVALNLRDTPASLLGVNGRIAIASDRRRDGKSVDGTLRLPPWEAALVDARPRL
jgi:Domain of unknown function (DUF3459)